MKNQLEYEGLHTKPKNNINLERLLFLKERQKQLKPKIRLSNQLSSQVIEHIKNYLTQDKYHQLIQNSFGNTQKKDQIRSIIHSYVSSKDFLTAYSSLITDYSLDEIADYLVEKITGLDVLQPLTEIPTLTDINCISYDNIWVDDIEKGKYKTDIRFESKQDYLELCERFAFASGKPYSHARPSVDAIFPYMRINIVGQDLSTNVSLSIRIITKTLRFDERHMIKTGYANQQMIDVLKRTFATESHLITGATGTGKTELLRYFTRYTKERSDIIMIEDTPETYLDELYPDKPIKMWKNRESNDDEKKSFGYTYHIRNAMRQHPIYIFLQESRGEESADILDASETGHIVNTTLHAKDALVAIPRFISLCQRAEYHPNEYYGVRIVNGFSIGIHVKRIGNVRIINQIVEYTGFENMHVEANILFEYDSNLKTHVQSSKMSHELWERLSEIHGEMPEIQSLSPKYQMLYAHS